MYLKEKEKKKLCQVPGGEHMTASHQRNHTEWSWEVAIPLLNVSCFRILCIKRQYF